MSQRAVPSTFDVLATLVRVTLQRLFRGRAVWVCVGIALLPSFIGSFISGRHHVANILSGVEMLVMILLPAILVASSIGEEIEERTTTYLWSRPIPRWTVIVGKLLALAPIAMVLVVGGWFIAIQFAVPNALTADILIAFGAGALAVSVMSAGLATLVPKQGMALAIVYLVIIDLAIGVVPASLQNISLTRQVALLSGIDQHVSKVQPIITMVIIAGVWLVIGLLRLRRRES